MYEMQKMAFKHSFKKKNYFLLKANFSQLRNFYIASNRAKGYR